MVKYEWDESNGVSVPTNKLMVIDADEYYVGMPLKKVDAETVAPTDGDPEYICLAQRNAGDEIRPLQIPVQEVFPDAVYTKILEDGTEEKVKFGGGGGGAFVVKFISDESMNLTCELSYDEILAEYEKGIIAGAIIVDDKIMAQYPNVSISGDDGDIYFCTVFYSDGKVIIGYVWINRENEVNFFNKAITTS